MGANCQPKGDAKSEFPRFSYDKLADVLYVRLADHTEADCHYAETDHGIRRIAPGGVTVGLTIPFFLERNGVLANPD
jgi:hypothetical protein